MTRIALALNVADPERAWEWFGRIGSKVDCCKLQMDLFGRAGPDLIRRFVAAGAEVLLDLKLHDIPSVVAASVRAAGETGARLPTVHGSGGAMMMAEAASAGVDYIVVGPPMCEAPDPVAAIAEIRKQLGVGA